MVLDTADISLQHMCDDDCQYCNLPETD